MIARALRSSARSAGGWTLEPASLRTAHRRLGGQTDQVLVGGAVTFLILATLPAAAVGGSIIVVSGRWLSGAGERVGLSLGFTTSLIPACTGFVLAVWRATYEWSGRTRRRPFILAYGSNRPALSRASTIGALVAVLVGVLTALTIQ